LHAATVLHSALGITGLTINRWLTAVSPEQRASDVATAVMITAGLPQHFDVAAVYPLDRIANAVRHVSQPGKVGTVVVRGENDAATMRQLTATWHADTRAQHLGA
jgi:hypothetical protein